MTGNFFAVTVLLKARWFLFFKFFENTYNTILILFKTVLIIQYFFYVHLCFSKKKKGNQHVICVFFILFIF